jgi:hypothetical protein
MLKAYQLYPVRVKARMSFEPPPALSSSPLSGYSHACHSVLPEHISRGIHPGYGSQLLTARFTL